MAGSATGAPAIVVEGATGGVPNRSGSSAKPADWNAEPGVFWVYVIQSEADGTVYVGQTNDLAGRIRQHNDPATNRSRYTKRHPGVWRLVHAERASSRAGAMARERFLKTGQGRAWLRAVLSGGASPPQRINR